MLIAAGVFSCGASAADLTLSLEGYGPLKFGSTADRVLQLLRDEKPYNVAASSGCQQITPPQFAGTGLSLTIEDRKLVRIDIDFTSGSRETSAKTDTGIGLGSAEAEVLAAYPNAVIKRNPDDPTWHTIKVETADRGLLFETNGQTVKSIRAGLRDIVLSAEACN
jgi:hypothetical protein